MKYNSIRWRLIALTIVFLIPLLLFLNLSNVYYSRLTQKRTAEAGADLIGMYLNLTDARIKEISDALILFTATNQNLNVLNHVDEDTRQYARIRLQDYMENLISRYNAADNMFIFGARYGHYGYVHGTNSAYRLRQAQRQYLEENIFGHDTSGISQWNSVVLGDESYLLWILQVNDIYVGVWVNVEELERPLEDIPNSDEAQFVLTDLQDMPLTNARFIEEKGLSLHLTEAAYVRSGSPQTYILTGAQSKVGGYRLYMAFPQQNILENLDTLQMFIFIFSAFALLLIPAMLQLFRKNLLHPLNALTAAVGAVQQGNLEYQIGAVKAPDEFLRINHAFDKMTVQLKDYKIKEYEEALTTQKLKLAYLQMQIRPHFFLNALMTVSNLFKTGQVERMERFIQCLAGYMRYRFYSNIKMVLLHEELAHVENYLSMQEMSYSGILSHFFDIDPDAEAVPIPPFTLHNFIENILKHAMESRDHVTVYVRAIVLQGLLKITIEDDGAGLTAQALSQLNDPDFEPHEGKNIGIWNIRKTLQILFGKEAQVVVEPSALSGTKVTIAMPITAMERGDEPDANTDF